MTSEDSLANRSSPNLSLGGSRFFALLTLLFLCEAIAGCAQLPPSAVLETTNINGSDFAPMTGGWYIAAANSSLDEGKPMQAEFAARRAIQLLEKAFGFRNPALPGAYRLLGIALYNQQKREEALKALTASLEILEATGQTNTIETALTSNQLGVLLRENGEPQGALDWFGAALGLYVEIAGRSNVFAAEVFGNLGMAANDLGKPDEAEKYFFISLGILNDVGVTNHPAVAAYILNNSARLYAWRGDYKAAAGSYLRSLQASAATFPDWHPLRFKVKANFATACFLDENFP